MSDAVRAYTQALLKGTETWIRLPREEWPKAWAGMRDPVVPLRLALYGHPDSGSHWEQHCDQALKAAGFDTIPNWPGCYLHQRLSGFLVVYVDDFKLVAPKANLKALWKLIGQKLNLEPPTPFGRFLGCETKTYDVTLDPKQIPGFHTLSSVAEGEKQSSAHRKAKVMEYDMCLFMRSCVNLYEELTGKPLPNRDVHTPFLDDETNWTEQGERGELADVALKILMKVLYGARMCRYDILRATCLLARRVSKWDKECDKRLHRLIMYIRPYPGLPYVCVRRGPTRKVFHWFVCRRRFRGLQINSQKHFRCGCGHCWSIDVLSACRCVEKARLCFY